MAVDDHGLEVLKKSGEEVTPGDKSDYYIKVSEINPSSNVAKTSPVIHNINLPLANTEYSQAFQTNVKSFIVRPRSKTDLQFAFTSGESATNYITLKAYGVYEETGISVSNLTIYLQSGVDNTEVEILEWA